MGPHEGVTAFKRYSYSNATIIIAIAIAIAATENPDEEDCQQAGPYTQVQALTSIFRNCRWCCD
jgi:hypothetical protein